MLTLQSHAGKIVQALRDNTVVLFAPPGEVTDEHKFAAGKAALDMLRQRSRLQPSYWSADGNEAETLVDSLDDLAKLTPTLYFSVQCLPDVKLDDALEYCDPLVFAHQARANHCWLNAFRVRIPTDEMLRDVGDWLYALRDGRPLDAAPPPAVIAVSINAS